MLLLLLQLISSSLDPHSLTLAHRLSFWAALNPLTLVGSFTQQLTVVALHFLWLPLHLPLSLQLPLRLSLLCQREMQTKFKIPTLSLIFLYLEGSQQILIFQLMLGPETYPLFFNSQIKKDSTFLLLFFLLLLLLLLLPL